MYAACIFFSIPTCRIFRAAAVQCEKRSDRLRHHSGERPCTRRDTGTAARPPGQDTAQRVKVVCNPGSGELFLESHAAGRVTVPDT